jgi:ABC-type proline/glycine betaine transport system ATPase subunit
MTMGDRVAVLKDGVLQQVDTPAWLLVLTAGVPGNSAIGVGERIMLRPHHDQVHVFSPTTGERLD